MQNSGLILNKKRLAVLPLDLDINFRTKREKEVLKVYIQRMWIYGDTIDVQKTYTLRQGKGYMRAARCAATPEAMKKYNEKCAMRTLTRTINANFTVDDIHLTLTYRKEDRPMGDDEFIDDLRKFMRKLRRIYKKAGQELKYISVSAIGKRGSYHHHLIITGIDLRLITKLWNKGGMHPVFLYSKCDYKNLAQYFIDQTNEEGGRTVGRRWNCSRNIIHPVAKVTEVDAETWREPPIALPGYEIDYDTLECGENPFTGIPYCYYRMTRRKINKPLMTPDGRLLQPDAADRWLREEEFRRARAEYDPKNKIVKRSVC